jgi:hypothetical protein
LSLILIISQLPPTRKSCCKKNLRMVDQHEDADTNTSIETDRLTAGMKEKLWNSGVLAAWEMGMASEACHWLD